MKPIFADTSYYVALFGPRDRHHADAVELAHALRQPVIVTEFVLLELGGAVLRGGDRRTFVGLLPHLQSDPDAEIIPASRRLFQRGFELLPTGPRRNGR